MQSVWWRLGYIKIRSMEIVYTENAKKLATSVGDALLIPTFPACVRKYRCGEFSVSVQKSFSNVCVMMSAIGNEDWLTLFFLLDALKDADKMILCVPYMGYLRQDAPSSLESNGADVVCRFIEQMNVSKLILLDIHSNFTNKIPTTYISAIDLFEKDIRAQYNLNDIVIVSPDIGGATRAAALARTLECGFVLCNKTRDVFGNLKKIEIIGDVSGKVCILVDDMIDTGTTLRAAAGVLLDAGCDSVSAYVTHAIFSGNAMELLETSAISSITITNSIPQNIELTKKIKKISIDSLIIEAIRCIL